MFLVQIRLSLLTPYFCRVILDKWPSSKSLTLGIVSVLAKWRWKRDFFAFCPHVSTCKAPHVTNIRILKSVPWSHLFLQIMYHVITVHKQVQAFPVHVMWTSQDWNVLTRVYIHYKISHLYKLPLQMFIFKVIWQLIYTIRKKFVQSETMKVTLL